MAEKREVSVEKIPVLRLTNFEKNSQRLIVLTPDFSLRGGKAKSQIRLKVFNSLSLHDQGVKVKDLVMAVKVIGKSDWGLLSWLSLLWMNPGDCLRGRTLTWENL